MWQPQETRPCNICLDNVTASSLITSVCGSTCPAVVCAGCLADHIRVAIDAAFPGVLPRVRCPICLVAVNKSRWQAVATREMLAAYGDACKSTCSFRTPCCHNANYTQLPYAFDATDKPFNYIRAERLRIVPSLKVYLDPLRQLTRRFCNHKATSKELIQYIVDTFGGGAVRGGSVQTQHSIVENLLPRIADEERRATLLLAYHHKYTGVTTTCCRRRVCFNCKRFMATHSLKWHGDKWRYETFEDVDRPCDDCELDVSCIIECPSCHVTLVKVDGCDAVQCWCGHSMNWGNELKRRREEEAKRAAIHP